MHVLKFGGSSLANAQLFLQVASIITRKASGNPLSIVVSAPRGITSSLIRLTTSTSNYQQKCEQISEIKREVQTIAHDLQKECNSFDLIAIEKTIEPIFDLLETITQGADLLQSFPDSAIARVLSCGEKISVALLDQLLCAHGLHARIIDPHQFILTENSLLSATVNLEASKQKFAECYPSLEPLSIMPGFIGANRHGQTTTLGRNGSDYSAAILAICSQASRCEIWTDVNGIYNADPNRVKNATLVPHFSYEEAMELSYFGAKVLHPKTIAPIAQHHIPCLIKNTYAPEGAGTLIASNPDKDHPMRLSAVRAISSLENITMVTISGPGMKGRVGIAGRIFSAVSQAGISLVMISQSSSEYAISFCLHSYDTENARSTLNETLNLELSSGQIEPITLTQNLAIVSLIGDNMRRKQGVAAKFFSSLSQAQVNIIAIAQDASERSISAVITNKHCTQALKVCHQNFFSAKKSIDVFIVGCGTVGGELLNQIARQQASLQKQNIALNVYGISNSQGIYLNSDGMTMCSWQDELNQIATTLTVDTLSRFVRENHLINPVLVDCTCSDEIAKTYTDFLLAGFHVVTPNKKASTGEYAYYQAIQEAANKTYRRFLYETTVGAGLPVIDTLQSLFRAGDELIQFEGILSGSLSYIFGKLEEGISLSTATALARKNGYTEPDPRDDLSGIDVARKLLIIAREAGMILSLADIQVESFLPESLLNAWTTEEFMEKLPSFDETFSQRAHQAALSNKVLRYVGRINEGRCTVSIEACDAEHPLHAVKDGENAMAIYTRYYQPLPFILRGYGAGAKVTAAGIFGDLLRTLSWVKDSSNEYTQQ